MHRRSVWLGALALGALMLTGTAGAAHLGSLQLGHPNTANAVTSLTCSQNERCLHVQNNSTGNLAYAGNFNSNSGAAAAIRATAFNNSFGVWGLHNSADGTYAGVFGETKSDDFGASGVFGRATAAAGATYGVHGETSSTSGSSAGVRGFGPDTGFGVIGLTEVLSSITASGVGGIGVVGYEGSSTTAGIGVYGFGDSFGVWSQGNLHATGNGTVAGNLTVTGTLSKGAGTFKIDHPLDPARKYLSHSFIESPDMMNVYNGNVTTDGNGFATVKLPAYFGALNRDFRYQLTVVGRSFAEAIVWDEIAANRFTIRTDEPGVKVSWQVTGIRKDAYANANRVQPETLKSKADRGKYLHPAAFGKPRSLSLSSVSNPLVVKTG
jgi:hypothetical protein